MYAALTRCQIVAQLRSSHESDKNFSQWPSMLSLFEAFTLAVNLGGSIGFAVRP
jgi:hypothetical protein